MLPQTNKSEKIAAIICCICMCCSLSSILAEPWYDPKTGKKKSKTGTVLIAVGLTVVAAACVVLMTLGRHG